MLDPFSLCGHIDGELLIWAYRRLAPYMGISGLMQTFPVQSSPLSARYSFLWFQSETSDLNLYLSNIKYHGIS